MEITILDGGMGQELVRRAGRATSLWSVQTLLDQPGISAAFDHIGATVDLLQSRYDLDPASYAGFAARWASLGATVIGGCCEVGPAHIAELARRLKTSR